VKDPVLANRALVDDPQRVRTHLRAMGLDDSEPHKPIIGIATTWTGTMPCNLSQRTIRALTEWLKRGIPVPSVSTTGAER